MQWRRRVQQVLQFVRRYWRWSLRALVALIIFSALRPAPPRIRPVEPQTVQTEHPQVCVHTRLIDEVDEWKIQRSLELTREMGAGTIIEFFPWAYIEANEGVYDWTQADRIVRHAREQGIRIIARMGFVPGWAQPDDEDARPTLNTLLPDSYPDFADFVAAFAARYAETINHLIIWNEPNLAFEWGYRPVNPAEYVALLQAVYTPAQQANPNVVILAAPLAPTLEQPGSPAGLDDLLYLRGMYEAGGSDYFDALAIHTYGFTEPPEAAPDEATLNYRRAELLRDIMVEFNDAVAPVFITETGWNDHPRWAYAVSPAERIAYTLDGLRWAETHWAWAETVCLWALRFPTIANNYPDYFALVSSDFQVKPIYEMVRAYARGLPLPEALWLSSPATVTP